MNKVHASQNFIFTHLPVMLSILTELILIPMYEYLLIVKATSFRYMLWYMYIDIQPSHFFSGCIKQADGYERRYA